MEARVQPPSRRRFLGWAAGGLFWGCGGSAALRQLAVTDIGQESIEPELRDARFEGLLRFAGRQGRLEQTVGRGHEGRRYVDLSTVDGANPVLPNERFYIRTRCPDRIDFRRPWRVTVGGEADGLAGLDPADLARRASDRGVHLLECSGNGGSFGLLSSARWQGVPLSRILADLPARRGATRVRVSGFDEHSSSPPDSPQNGASWIFGREELEAAGAFLATGMNGEALSRDHGFPLRLMVPGWYGCAAIKWVDRIDLVGEDAVSSPHMREFAGRTHQRGSPLLARDFRPAWIDTAAMVTRVERWRGPAGLIHLAQGLVWGGRRPVDRLEVQFGRSNPFEPVAFAADTTRTWAPWRKLWRPSRAGTYAIRLRVPDGDVPTRRLDRGYYTRGVRVTEVNG